MSAKTSAARTDAFFTALAETGNQTISAERARVSRSWVSLHRSADPEFKARMEACVAEAREQLSAASAVKTSAKWAVIDGEELVVRGSNGRRAQVSRARLKQWTARGEARFLSVLSATCNVKMACNAVGLSVPSAYMHRYRWPGFAKAWDAAVEEGYASLEAAMLENAMASLEPQDPRFADFEPAFPMEKMSPAHGMALLYMHKNKVARDRSGETARLLEQRRTERAKMTDRLLNNMRVYKERMDAGEMDADEM